MTLIYTPRDYQVEAGRRILTNPAPGFGLFVEPGGGKTVTVLTAADHLINEALQVDRLLVVGPRLVAQEVWHRECAKWAHLQHLETRLITFEDFGQKRLTVTRTKKGKQVKETLLAPGDPKAVRKALLDDPRQIHVISRDHLYTLVKLLGKRWPYRMVAADESSSFKDATSNRSRALRYLMRHGLVERAVLMSGTPSPKGLEQLWAQVLIMDNGERLGATQTAFRERFMVPDKRNKERVFSWKPVAGATDEVMSLVADICMSVRADVWRQNEPPRTVQKRVTLPPAAKWAYDVMVRDSVLRVGGSIAAAVNAGVQHGKLSQIASGILFDEDRQVHEIHEAKLDALEEVIEELNGEPVVVLYWYAPNLARLKKRFPKFATTKTPGFIDKFGAGELPGLFLQPAGAGHGLDGLQHGGHHVIAYDLHPDWELYKQAIDRIDRSGQRHQVTVTQIIANDTQDDDIASVLADRGADQAKVMDAIAFGMEGVLARLSTHQGADNERRD